MATVNNSFPGVTLSDLRIAWCSATTRKRTTTVKLIKEELSRVAIDEVDGALVAFLRVCISSQQMNAPHRPLKLRLYEDSTLNTVADEGGALAFLCSRLEQRWWEKHPTLGKWSARSRLASSLSELGTLIHTLTAFTVPTDLDKDDHCGPKTVNVSYSQRPHGLNLAMGASLGGFQPLKEEVFPEPLAYLGLLHAHCAENASWIGQTSSPIDSDPSIAGIDAVAHHS
ncbi:hypothetical protein FB451DRAFT_1161903 [Mycena latifolia]|nr:hypothetical protein FB451DRAFT_1161903 [Mycena latifolia]